MEARGWQHCHRGSSAKWSAVVVGRLLTFALKLADAKSLLAQLQQVVVSQQLRDYCAAGSPLFVLPDSQKP